MERKAIDIWVGLFVAAGLAAMVFLALKVGNLLSFQADDGYVVSARFTNIGGLKVRAPVRSSGVLVGRVAGIHFDNQTYEAVVDMQLDKAYRFPKDTSAAILTSGLLGEQYIGLAAGGEDAVWRNGDKASITSSALVLENLISQFLFSKAAETPAAKPEAK